MGKVRGWKFVCAVIFAVGGCLFGANSQAAEVAGQPQAELEQAAWDAFKNAQADFDADMGATVEDLYRWSRRIRDAELAAGKPNALVDHRDRMQEIHKKAAALFKMGAKGASSYDFHATRYYLLKAEAALKKPPAK